MRSFTFSKANHHTATQLTHSRDGASVCWAFVAHTRPGSESFSFFQANQTQNNPTESFKRCGISLLGFWVKHCDVFVQSWSLFGGLLYESMADSSASKKGGDDTEGGGHRVVHFLEVDERKQNRTAPSGASPRQRNRIGDRLRSRKSMHRMLLLHAFFTITVGSLGTAPMPKK